MCEKEPMDTGSSMEQADELQRLREENEQLRKQIEQLKAAADKVEYSKLIFDRVSRLAHAVTAFSCLMILITRDTSALAILIPAVFAELAAATGFYFDKAKVENKIKLMAHYGVKPEASDFNDS